MKTKMLIFIVLQSLFLSSFSQQKPKLMVGIVVDQMRPEYLWRFQSQYTENGFKKLLNKGFNFTNTHIDYVPTVTGPGHASIYSGTTPRYHGIVSNDWYDRILKTEMYCAYDSLIYSVGNEKPEKGSYSARNLISTNICDELKMFTAGKGKVIAMSLKDRGATLPAGHMADAAFWFDQKTGNFISSTFYINELPSWVKTFNQQRKADQYLKTAWELLLPLETYQFSLPDDNPFEPAMGKDKPIFPYNLEELSKTSKNKYSPIYGSPWGNSILADLAIETIEKSDLGRDNIPDILAISFSSTDVVGHAFGPHSKELNDVYVRLDRDIQRLLEALDKHVGEGNYTLFLTADHGVAEPPKFLMANKMAGGFVDMQLMKKSCSDYLDSVFGKANWIESQMDEFIYLDHQLINSRGIALNEIQNKLAEFLRDYPAVAYAFTANSLENSEMTDYMSGRVYRGFQRKRSGDVRVVLEPGYNELSKTTATHCTGYAYDTNIPLLWYGAGVPHGESHQHYDVSDIAPTVSVMLRTKYPSACIGDPIQELFKKDITDNLKP